MSHNETPVRLLSVQYGDYLAAWEDRARGRPETYRAQHYSLDCFDRLTEGGELLVVCLDSPVYDEKRGHTRMVGGDLAPRGRGLGYLAGVRRLGGVLSGLIEGFAPTHVVARTPGPAMGLAGRLCLARNIPVLPLFADYFDSSGLKARLKNWPLVRLLNRPEIPVVANHNYPACDSMVRAGVDAAKVVPYDWPQQRHPSEAAVKRLSPPPFRVVFAGQTSVLKGLGDLIEACSILVSDGMDIRLEIFGEGPEREGLARLAASSGLERRADFHGTAPNREVVAAMAGAHAVAVPSRHEYPEGVPCVIYESFETRTPVVLSDHPSFSPRIRHGRGCLVFPAKDAKALARSLASCLTDPGLYASLSRSTLEAWEAIQCPVDFGELLRDWVEASRASKTPTCLRWALAGRGGGK